MQVWDLAIDSAGHVFAAIAGAGGVWMSDENGENWKNQSSGLKAKSSILGLAISGGFLYAGTGYGVWKRPLSEMTGTSGTISKKTPSVADFVLEQNYPNPFRTATQIRFRLPRPARVTLAIHRVSGQAVRNLIDERLNAGANMAVWDGKDGGGNLVEPGIYICRLRSGSSVLNRKMFFVK
jgi:hypothetical protein